MYTIFYYEGDTSGFVKRETFDDAKKVADSNGGIVYDADHRAVYFAKEYDY